MDNLILSPFIWILKILFQLSTSLSSNLGLSIILLSLLIYLITFPLIKLVEKLSSKEEAKKTRIKHLIEEINSAYKGQTRFFYTKALYKIHGINPLSDLFGIGKLLLQIPFFLAAYHYLSSLEVFNGVSFLFISDLSKVDQAIPFAGIKLNILPVLMFIINTISAWIFAKENKNEFFTLFITGALFLFLLYPMPAALVLYWTCNNIISLIVETYKSRSWIKDKVDDLNFKANIKYFLNRNDHTFMFLCLLLHTSIASYCLDTNYLLVTPYYSIIFISAFGFVTYLYLELTGRIRSYEETNILNLKQSYLLLLGCFSPLFLYAKENYVYIQDGLILNYFLSLIIPSIALFSILYFALIIIGKKERIFTFTLSLFIFFCAPILNNLLNLSAETALPYTLTFFVIIYLSSLKLPQKALKPIAYFSFLIFCLTALDFLQKHNDRRKIENKTSRQLEKNSRRNKILEAISNNNIKGIPSIYFLVYDGLTGPAVNKYYGINNNNQFNFLKKNNFTLYNDILSFQKTSILSIAATLELSKRSPIKRTSYQRKNLVGFNIVDEVYEYHQKRRLYSASPHFFKGQIKKDNAEVVILGSKKFNGLLNGVLIGEFKFDIERFGKSKLTWGNIKEKYLSQNFDGFQYMHYGLPGHSQNSGKCLETEVSDYQERLESGNKRMKEDIELINKSNPNAIVIVAGDHGGYLSFDCIGNRTKDYKGSDLSLIADTYGTFLAIRWPDNNFKEYDDIHTLQGVFVSILAYIMKDKNFLKFGPQGKICAGETCVKEDGTMLTGPYKGQNIFKALNNFKLFQY